MLIGRFDRATGRPYIEGHLVIPRSNLRGDISFLIDTGADTSVLMPADAQRIGVDYSTLTGEREAVGIGGVSRSHTEPVLLAFSDPGRSLYIYQVEIVIPEAGPEMLRLPSLLGRDILNRRSISYNPSRGRLTIRVVSADFTLPVAP
jgi:hypothetical protein